MPSSRRCAPIRRAPSATRCSTSTWSPGQERGLLRRLPRPLALGRRPLRRGAAPCPRRRPATDARGGEERPPPPPGLQAPPGQLPPLPRSDLLARPGRCHANHILVPAAAARPPRAAREMPTEPPPGARDAGSETAGGGARRAVTPTPSALLLPG